MPPTSVPMPLFAPTSNAAKRVIEFFTAQINNDNAPTAYTNATQRFAQSCEDHDIAELVAAGPRRIAAFIKSLKI